MIADAAATYVGNNTNVSSNEIQRRPAEEIDPDTDIQGLSVTTHVGHLSKIEIESAIRNGELAANKLLGEGIIQGALISVRGNIVSLGKLDGVKNI